MKSRTRIQVRFGDIDMAKHVHNAAYLHYFEQARLDFFKELAPKDWNWEEKGLILGRNEVDYLVPVKLFDELWVETFCDHVSNKSFTLSYRVIKKTKEGKEIICTKGRSILVCINYLKNETVPVYEEWRNKLLN